MKTPPDPNLPDATDSPGQFVSFFVPHTGVEYNYLRLGAPDPVNEALLPKDPNTPAVTGGATFAKGTLLYSTDTVTITAPTVSTFTTDSLSVTGESGGTRVYAASLTSASGIFGGEPSTVSFNNIDSLAMSMNASSNFVTGQALTAWNGNDQSIGFGGLLWANYGLTTNLFGGSILNITNTSLEIQGFGDYKMTPSHTVDAAGLISLSINPAASSTAAATLTTLLTTVMVAATAAATACGLGFSIKTRLASTADIAALTDDMKQSWTALRAATALIDGVQGLSIIAGVIMKIAQAMRNAAAVANPAPNLTISPASTSLTGVDIDLTADANMTVSSTTSLNIVTEGMGRLRGMGAMRVSSDGLLTLIGDSVSISNGAQTVTLSQAGITLSSGGNSIAISDAGIAINGQQLNNIAPLIQLCA